MVKNQTISPMDLPEFVRDAGVGEIVKLTMEIGSIGDAFAITFGDRWPGAEIY